MFLLGSSEGVTLQLAADPKTTKLLESVARGFVQGSSKGQLSYMTKFHFRPVFIDTFKDLCWFASCMVSSMFSLN